MKKPVYLAVFVLIIGLLVSMFAYSLPLKQVNTCPGKPYPVSNILTRSLQGVFLLNFGVGKIAESQVEKQINKLLNEGKVEVNVKTYSAMDLAAGKLKDFKIKGKNLAANGVYITSVEAKSLCDFIYLDYKKDPIEPLAPLYLGFKATISESDLNKIVNSKEYQENLTKVKLKLGSADLNLIEFLKPKFEIEGDKIFLTTDMHFIGTPKFVTIPLKMGAGLKVKNNKVRLTDMQMFSSKSGKNTGVFSDFVEKMTLAVVDISSMGNDYTEITIKNINVNNDKIDIDGTLWMTPNK